MTYLSISSQIIPGYSSLSKRRRAAFEESPLGLRFSSFVHHTMSALDELHASLGWWDHVFGQAEMKKQALKAELNQQRMDLMQELSAGDDYQTIMMWITVNTLKKEVPDVHFLGKNQQKKLAKAPFSQGLLAILPELDRLIAEATKELSTQIHAGIMQGKESTLLSHIDELNSKKKRLIAEWNTAFNESPEMAPLRKHITTRKEVAKAQKIAEDLERLKEHAQQLASFFPLLYYRTSTTALPMIHQLSHGYLLDNGELTSEATTIDENHLADILYHCMQTISDIEIAFISLEAFNKNQAKHMAQVILQTFNENNELDINAWLAEYEMELFQHMIKELRLIHGARIQTTQLGITEGLLNSLSSLFHNKTTESVNEFIRKLGDAHAFIQATGFSTQNESSFLAILDAYNYGQHIEHIAEAKSIITSLLRPLLPLYDEYKDIAFYEKNELWKAFRTIMPLLITVAFIILVAALLSPLALPELAFAAAFVPALLIGISLAAKYVSVKNIVYKNIRDYYYGGSFEIPEFQVNERMVQAFQNDVNALKVRTFYVNALVYCDKMEILYNSKQKKGLLTEADIAARKENTNQRHQLCLEWYDIHSNNDLSYTDLPQIVLHRLQVEIDKEYPLLENVLREEHDSIHSAVQQVTADLKATIVNHSDPLAGQERGGYPTISAQYTPGLFSPPRCLPHKAHIEDMTTLSAQIRPS